MTAPKPVSPKRGGFIWARITVLVLGGAAAWIVMSYPSISSPVLECQVKRLTGYECPACGITRGLSALVHGRFGEALDVYPFAFPVAFGTVLVMIGALLPDRIWKWLMAIRWFPWLLGLGAGLTGFGILARWMIRCL